MIEYLSSMIKGFITIKDADTGEVLVDKTNAVHFGNISTEIAQALVGDNKSFITYMAFGNGGVIIDGAGNIVYRKPNTSINKNSSAQLYNSTLVVEMTNEASGIDDPNVTVPNAGTNTSNYEDITAVVFLEQEETIEQQNIDNATGSNNQDSSNNTTEFVFNEIALYCGEEDLPGQRITGTANIQNFVTDPDNILITHVIFHPVQKSANRTLEITYTLRIQMGE